MAITPQQFDPKALAQVSGLSNTANTTTYTAPAEDGVQIDLIVRGACSLRPGIPGVSENIRVRSIVGRFLEHSRVYWFNNDGNPETWCSSADWLYRNLLRRVETCFPIRDPKLASRVHEEALQNYLSDNTQAWHLQAAALKNPPLQVFSLGKLRAVARLGRQFFLRQTNGA